MYNNPQGHNLGDRSLQGITENFLIVFSNSLLCPSPYITRLRDCKLRKAMRVKITERSRYNCISNVSLRFSSFILSTNPNCRS